MGWSTETLGPVGAGVAEGFSLEGGGGSELEPLLPAEGVDDLLLLALFTVVLLVFAECHL